jgi:thiol-disulfide isomerase/thioredoxin
MSLLFLLLTLFLLVLLKLTAERSGYFEGFADAPAGELIIAKAEWCGHCQKAMPEFKKLMALGSIPMKSGGSCVVRMLDSDQDGAEIKKLGVQGFPTVMAKVGGNTYEYSGERTADAIKDFVGGIEA